MIAIPKQFSLFGSNYRVVLKHNLRIESGCEGIHNYRLKKIELQSVGEDQTEDAVFHAFYHELIHAILTQMGEGDLNCNEKFVDIFAGLLHQAITTAVYDTMQDGGQSTFDIMMG